MLKNVEVLDSLIVGRVEPHIYAFSTNTVPNYLKVGDTYRPVSVRLGEWRKYFPTLNAEYEEKATVNGEVFFRDYSVHQYLEDELGRKRLKPDDIQGIYYSNEFFKDAAITEVAEAINDIREKFKRGIDKYKYYDSKSRLPETYTYASTGLWKPRPNQQATIDRFTAAVKKGRKNLLMYAVMRFGKSFTSLCCAKEIGARIILVVSAKADVCEEWKKTVQQADNFNQDYAFLSGTELANDGHIVKSILSSGKGVVIFLTLQDLQGEIIKEKHKEIFGNTIDLLIIDETHYGARGEKYGQVLQDHSYVKDINEKYADDDYVDYDAADEKLKNLNANVKLHLSGTPYRILMGSEFTKEDIIAFYQFTDIVEEQKKWDEENILSDDVKEWDNPYYGFPQMIRFAFQPSRKAQAKLEELKANGNTYAFSALFKPESIKKSADGSHKKFVYEKEVLDLFEVIDGCRADTELLGFLDYSKIKDGNMCRHVVCVLPYCASCDALEKLLSDNRDRFKNLQDYTVINISGIDTPNKYKSIKAVKEKIAQCEEKGEKTLTLTVNRMLTGSTVEQWDTMLFLKDTASPQEYDQAVFRLQNQYIKTYVNENGETIKFNMKPQTLLVDFDPHRMFSMQEQKALIYNVNTDKGGNQKLEERMREELELSPIITMNKDKIVQVEPADILYAVSAYSKNQSVIDETRAIPVDMSLLDIDIILSTIERQSELGSKSGLQLAVYGDGEDELEVGDGSKDENSNGNGNDESQHSDKHKKEELSQTERQKLEDKFRMYYSRILFYAFLAEEELKSLDDILDSLKKENNTRIAGNLALSEAVLRAIRENMNWFILNQLDYKIQNINALSHDENVEPLERAVRAIHKFGKLSESEVPTPLGIAADMTALLPDDCIIHLRRENTAVLDIASKMGEFAIALCKRAQKLGIDVESINSSILAIPTSTVAYEFTRKIYTVLGLDTESIASNFVTYDLLDIKMDNSRKYALDSIDYNKIAVILKQKRALCKIKLSDKVKEGDGMKFEAVVGNPPYQKIVSKESGNRSLGKQLFPSFIVASIHISDRYVTLITPSKWFAGNGQDGSFPPLRQFARNNNHFKEIHHFGESGSFFSGVELGAVSYFLYDTQYEGDTRFSDYCNGEKHSADRPLFEEGVDIIISMNSMVDILKKVKNHPDFETLTKITTGRDAFGIISKNADKVSSERKFAGAYELRCAHEKLRYIKKEKVKKNKEIADKWKIFISKGNGGAGTLSDNRQVAILGKAYVAKPKSVCTDSLFPIGCFDTKKEAVNLSKYLSTKFARFMVGILKTSQNITQIVYRFVPMQNFTDTSDISWDMDIKSIDAQLYAKYGLSQQEIDYIEEKIKPVE